MLDASLIPLICNNAFGDALVTIAAVIGDWDDASLQTKPVHCLPYNPDSSGIGRLSIPHQVWYTFIHDGVQFVARLWYGMMNCGRV